ncbi:ABC transporter ATP-binding protein [Ruminococcus sp. HUN007]|uniref:ABC transporter ATP-binding protein n=1 Tax=Ruminococcus sp. HUN007 TaxID=1514668 RepID=UPI00067911B4|nr:ABC transporter ATP-binding protein [Ruminococcus sp. HUN007]
MTVKTMKRIFSYTAEYKTNFVLAVIFAVIGVAGSLLVPILTGRAIDYISGKGDVQFGKILRILTTLAVSVVISSVSQWIMAKNSNILSSLTARDIRDQYLEKLSRVPVGFVDSRSRGDLISRASVDIETVSDALTQGFTQFLTGIVTIAGTLIFMVCIDLKIALIVIVLTPLSLAAAWIITKLTHNAFTDQSTVRGNLSGLADEMIKNQNLVEAFDYSAESQRRFEAINDRFGSAGLKATFLSSMTNPVTRFINGIIYALVGMFGALSVVKGRITVGTLVSFLSYANQYTKPFNEISGVVSELQNALASAERIFAVIDSEDEEPDEGKPLLEDPDGSVLFDNISFSYVPEKPLLRNITIDVKPGQRVAIVGPTGCGKTTLINLLMRFYDTTNGNVVISGKNVRDVTRDSLRSCFGMVLQETWLFSGSIRENISYGKPDATEDEIIKAAKAAHAHSFIKRLPDGYDTVIGENGGSLSQGQKQLLTIARIMLTDPPMLILDEATSNIDIRTEVKIQKAFEELMKGKTSFIIAHRLSTIRNTDMILVMRDGNIVEHGNHKELIARNGFYRQLYEAASASK